MADTIWQDAGRESAGCLTQSDRKSAGIGRMFGAVWHDVARKSARCLVLSGGLPAEGSEEHAKPPIVGVFSWLAEGAGAPANPRL